MVEKVVQDVQLQVFGHTLIKISLNLELIQFELTVDHLDEQ